MPKYFFCLIRQYYLGSSPNSILIINYLCWLSVFGGVSEVLSGMCLGEWN